MAEPILRFHNDLWLLTEEIQERLENARTSTKALLILKERVLIEAACADAAEAFKNIAGQAMLAVAHLDAVLRERSQREAPCLTR
jgi:hypothetical protein